MYVLTKLMKIVLLVMIGNIKYLETTYLIIQSEIISL